MAIKMTPERQAKQQARYDQAVAAGKGDQFLRNRPKVAANLGVQAPPKAGRAFNKTDAKTSNILDQSADYSQNTNVQATQAQNVGSVSDPFGSASGGYNPETGRYEITHQESAGQQGIREGFEGAAGSMLGQAGNLAGGYNQFNWQGSPEERARIEEEMYGRLTRNVDRDFNQEFEALEQRMHNRGIPLDPSNPAYKRELDSLNEKYDNIRSGARGQAVEMGGSEMQRSFGMGLGSHQQGMADMGQMYGQGMGAYQGGPQLGFNASEYNQQDPGAMWLNRRGQDIQREIANKQLAKSGGGGGGAKPAAPSRPNIVG